MAKEPELLAYIRKVVIKKTFLFIMLLFPSLPLLAAEEVNVKSGDPGFIVSEASMAILEIDYSDAVVEKEETITEYLNRRGEDWVDDWPDVQKKVKDVFVKYFNKKNKKGMKLTEDSISATYKMIINVTAIDFGSTGATMAHIAMPGVTKKKAGGASISGTVDVLDISTNEVLCSMEINNAGGYGSYSETMRLKNLVFILAKKILSSAKKT